MNLMLVVLFASVGIGLFGHKIVRHETKLVTILVTSVVVIYFLHPLYMT